MIIIQYLYSALKSCKGYRGAGKYSRSIFSGVELIDGIDLEWIDRVRRFLIRIDRFARLD